jgi:hypothetical protein
MKNFVFSVIRKEPFLIHSARLLSFFLLLHYVFVVSCQPIVVGSVPEKFNFTIDSASINVTQRYRDVTIIYKQNNQIFTVEDVSFLTAETRFGKSVNIVRAYRVLGIAASKNITQFEIKSGNRSLGFIKIKLEEDKSKFYGQKIHDIMFNDKAILPRNDLSTYTFDFPI